MAKHGFGHWRDVLTDPSLVLMPILRHELGLTPAALQGKETADKVSGRAWQCEAGCLILSTAPETVLSVCEQNLVSEPITMHASVGRCIERW